MKITMFASITAIMAALSAPAAAVPVYSNNFNSGSTTGFTGSGVNIIQSPSGEYFLGPLSTANNTGVATLTLDTAGLTSLTLSYDMYAIMTLDGDGPFGGNSPSNPDAFIVAVTGGPTLLDNSFANYSGDTQNYGGVGSAPQTGATAINTLGYSNSGDSTYAFTSTFAPTGATTVITFTGMDNQGVGDEFFGLDNVSVSGVSGVTGVPEPTAWVMMLLGVGVIGASLRDSRRRQDATVTS